MAIPVNVIVMASIAFHESVCPKVAQAANAVNIGARVINNCP